MEEIKGISNNTFTNLTITNNYVCTSSPISGTANQELDALRTPVSPGTGSTGSGWYGYGNASPNLPANLTNGNNMSYNGSVDSLGSAAQPLSIVSSNSGNMLRVERQYTLGMNPWSSSWTGSGNAPDTVPVTAYDYTRAVNTTPNNYGIVGATDNERKTRIILRFINLPSLKHIYFDGSLPSVSNFQNAYSIGAATGIEYLDKQGACFTTRGCHPDLKIHTGVFMGVDSF